MKRKTFLWHLSTISAILITPASVVAGIVRKIRTPKGIKVDAGKDRFSKPITPIRGDTFFSKLSGADSDGDLYIYESIRENEGGPPLHIHPEQDEWWYVLSGEFLIKVGDETFHAKTGDSVFGPRKVPHAFAKIGSETGKLLMVFQPAGKMEAFFQAMHDGKLNNLSEKERNEFGDAYGVHHVGPPLTTLHQYNGQKK